MDYSDVVVLGGRRTPFGKFGGALRAVPSVQLAAFALDRALAATGVRPDQVDSTYLGVTTPSEVALDGTIPARVAAVRAGIPVDRVSLTIDRACCSSMTAVAMAAKDIASGEARVVVAGGTDNMGRAPLLVPSDVRWGLRRGAPVLKDPMSDPGADIGGNPVAYDAGAVAEEFGIDRDRTDEWALRSHQRYFAALDRGFFDEEIIAYADDSATLDRDELPRRDSSLAKLGALASVLGTRLVTAGTAPGQDTGAAFVVLASRAFAEEHGLRPLATIAATASIARPTREVAIAPAEAIETVLSRAGWGLDEVDAIEINEAFACVPLASAAVLEKNTGVPASEILARTNVNGGAVAIGHPAGASGARLVLTLARQLAARGGGRGAAAICGGLAQGDAVALRAEHGTGGKDL
ncbi:thiolase family protein [Nocardia harenae]|uniref:thiolase family protein n=1 Tax=Nocardia harenae TaxID=358707 RepID=UPI00083561CA|nr:thiolase family protein [Nocardia harenae]